MRECVEPVCRNPSQPPAHPHASIYVRLSLAHCKIDTSTSSGLCSAVECVVVKVCVGECDTSVPCVYLEAVHQRDTTFVARLTRLLSDDVLILGDLTPTTQRRQVATMIPEVEYYLTLLPRTASWW